MNHNYKTRQAGVTMVELLIAMSLALFLMGGMYSILQTNRRASSDQNGLSRMQDNQRFALTTLAEVSEQSGFYPDPTSQLQNILFPSDANFPTTGAVVYGVTGTGTTGDTLKVRFVGGSNDGTMNCSGSSNTSANPVLYESVFSVNAQKQLVCSMNGGTPLSLVTGITNMSVVYGVKTTLTSGNTTFDTYKTAAQMTAANWPNVICIKLTLTFVNPLAADAGQPATITLTRVISIMNRTGVNT